MERVHRWMRRWWAEDERSVNMNDYFGLPARRPPWSAKAVNQCHANVRLGSTTAAY